MENKSIKVNLNGIIFNVVCNNSTDLKRVEHVFNKMFVSDYNSYSSDAMFNIYFSNNSEEYNDLSSNLLCSRSRHIMPNICEYDCNKSKIYHHYSGFYTYSKGNNYYIISDNSKYAPYYLILELYLKTSEMKKFYLFHGNGIEIDGTLINIIGYSHSGKTTLMSKLFQIDDVKKSFLSNDRILLGNNETLYFPLDINLDINTISHDKYLSQGVISKDRKIYVDPKSFTRCYPDLKYISRSDNHYFVIPKIDLLSKKNFEITHVPDEDALKVLNYCCFSVEDKECLRDDWIMKSSDKSELKKMANEMLMDIIKRYKVLLVEYGCELSGEKIYERIRKKN